MLDLIVLIHDHCLSFNLTLVEYHGIICDVFIYNLSRSQSISKIYNMKICIMVGSCYYIHLAM